MTTWLDGTDEGPTEVGPPLKGPTEENRLLLGAVALSPTQSGKTDHGPRLDGTNEGPRLGGPTEIGPPLGGPTVENRPLLGAVALSSTQLGTTGPSPMRLVTTGSCHHTGLTCKKTTRHGPRLDGTNEGPPPGVQRRLVYCSRVRRRRTFRSWVR